MKIQIIFCTLTFIVLIMISSCGNAWYYYKVDPPIQDINGMEIHYSLDNYLCLENYDCIYYPPFEPRFGATRDAQFCIEQLQYYTDPGLKLLPISINNGMILVNKDTVCTGLSVNRDISVIKKFGAFSGKEVRVINIGPFIIPGPIPENIEIKYDLVFMSPDSSEIVRRENVVLVAHRKGKSHISDFLDGR